MADARCAAAGLSDIGRVREENQDAFSVHDEFGLYVVADGMGGMQEGGLAARYVVEGLPTLLRQKLAQERSPDRIAALLQEGVDQLSRLLREKIGACTGSTVVLALLNGGEGYVAHLGDSRAYLFRAGMLQKLTNDHNVASMLVETGRIRPEEARVHPMRHRLTAYVGMEGNARPAVRSLTLQEGDRLLLSTDGLTGMVPDQEITRVLAEVQEREVALERLIALANEAGGHDNVTAVLIDYRTTGRKEDNRWE